MQHELTPKQEAFALKYAECSNATKAYRSAYEVGKDTKDETVWSEASRLLSDPKVTARILELQKQAQELCMVTVASITDELEQARQLAMKDDKGAAAATSASLGKAKLHGIFPDKHKIEVDGGDPIIIHFSERDKSVL